VELVGCAVVVVGVFYEECLPQDDESLMVV